MVETAKTCSCCNSWDRGVNDKGECRANPPSTHGWPKTKPNDWCASGWRQNLRQKPEQTNGLSFVILSENAYLLGFNYQYILNYPENACRWLKVALSRREDIPGTFMPVIADPDAVTALLSSVNCEDIMQWANKFDGFDNGAESDDDYMSLIFYADIEEDVRKSSEARTTMPADHIWLSTYRQLLPNAGTDATA